MSEDLHMTRKRNFAATLVLAASSAFGGIALADTAATSRPLPSFDRVMLTPPRDIADFALTDQRGQAFHLAQLRGRPVVLFFGYVHCPDVCPTTLQKFALLKSAAGKQLADVTVMMISVDGERDAPSPLAAFVQRFGEDFVGLTGSPQQVRDVAAQFRAGFFKDAPQPGSTDYLVGHSSQQFVIDAQGRLRAELYDAAPEAVTAILAALLAERATPGGITPAGPPRAAP